MAQDDEGRSADSRVGSRSRFVNGAAGRYGAPWEPSAPGLSQSRCSTGQTSAFGRSIRAGRRRLWVESVSSRTPAAVIRFSSTRGCVGMRLERREPAPDRSFSAAMFAPQISRQTWRGCVITGRSGRPSGQRASGSNAAPPALPALASRGCFSDGELTRGTPAREAAAAALLPVVTPCQMGAAEHIGWPRCPLPRSHPYDGCAGP